MSLALLKSFFVYSDLESKLLSSYGDPPLILKHSQIRKFVVDGIKLNLRVLHVPHYRGHKLPPLPLIFCIHGLGGQLNQFQNIIDNLSHFSEVVSVDLPGHGRSEYKSSWNIYTQEFLVKVIEAVLNSTIQESGREVVFVAHSMGCSLAAHLAIKLGIRCLGIIAICPPIELTPDQVAMQHRLAYVPAWAFNIFRVIDRNGGLNSASVSRLLSPHNESEENREKQLRWNLQVNTGAWIRTAYYLTPASKEVWSNVDCPVYLIGSEYDEITPSENINKIFSFLGPNNNNNNKHSISSTDNINNNNNNNNQQTELDSSNTNNTKKHHHHHNNSNNNIIDNLPKQSTSNPIILKSQQAAAATVAAAAAAAADAVSRPTTTNTSISTTSNVSDLASDISSEVSSFTSPTPPKSSSSPINSSPTLVADDDNNKGGSSSGSGTNTNDNDNENENENEDEEDDILIKPVIVHDTGHMCIIEKPEAISGLISDFIANHVDVKLSLAWQLAFLASKKDKWSLKNENKWREIEAVSDNIEGTPFRGMKTLRQDDIEHSPFTVEQNYPDLTDIIDISRETPPYDPSTFTKIKYHKFPTVSKLPPSREEVAKYIALVDSILEKNPSAIIGTHCHYGFNRTGFFLCCYMIERLGFTIKKALLAFRNARNPGIKHSHFIDELYVRYEL